MQKRSLRKKGHKQSATAVIAVAAVLVVAAVLALILLFGNGKETSEAPEETALETTAPVTSLPDETTAPQETTSAPETEPPAPVGPEFVNPLTGLEANADLSAMRPAAVMINNIKISCPQIGIRFADIMYECLAEGDITRLMVVTSDYAAIGTLGSVRSARDYFLDFAQNHDALFVHAGGSPDAYSDIASRNINNLDGVRMYIPDMFYRDQWRMANMGYEHSLMTTGEKIVNGIKYLGYRTELKSGFDSPFDFVGWDKSADMSGGDAALHVNIPFSVSEVVDMVYDPNTGLYNRYQFKGQPHIDGDTGEQMTFKNIFILCCDTARIAGDDKNRISVGTTGSDIGYYITDGKVIEVKWTKTGRDEPISFANTDGTPLLINRGRTYVAVTPQIKDKIQFNAPNIG